MQGTVLSMGKRAVTKKNLKNHFPLFKKSKVKSQKTIQWREKKKKSGMSDKRERSILNVVIRAGCTNKVAFELRPKNGKRASIWIPGNREL